MKSILKYLLLSGSGVTHPMRIEAINKGLNEKPKLVVVNNPAKDKTDG